MRSNENKPPRVVSENAPLLQPRTCPVVGYRLPSKNKLHAIESDHLRMDSN